MEPMSRFTEAERQAVLDRALVLLEADPRVEAAVITGSLGAGTADRWSDFDLAAILVDGVTTDEVAADWDALAYVEWPVAHHYATAFGSTLVRGYILRNGLLADMAFTPGADFSVWAPVRIAFDRSGRAHRAETSPQPWTPTPDWSGEAGFAAHDILHATVAARRGRPWQALYLLGRIRNRTLALASERLGHDSDDAAHVDDLPPDMLAALAGTLIGTLDEPSLVTATTVAASAFLNELGRGDPSLADRLAEPIAAMLEG